MKLEQQVTSLEISKRLKELGVKQESLYNWLEASDGARLMKNPVANLYRYFEQSSAFTVAELGEMLPLMWYVSYPQIKNEDIEKEWICEYDGMEEEKKKSFRADTEADARGKMLVYLLENKLI